MTCGSRRPPTLPKETGRSGASSAKHEAYSGLVHGGLSIHCGQVVLLRVPGPTCFLDVVPQPHREAFRIGYHGEIPKPSKSQIGPNGPCDSLTPGFRAPINPTMKLLERLYLDPKSMSNNGLLGHFQRVWAIMSHTLDRPQYTIILTTRTP